MKDSKLREALKKLTLHSPGPKAHDVPVDATLDSGLKETMSRPVSPLRGWQYLFHLERGLTPTPNFIPSLRG